MFEGIFSEMKGVLPGDIVDEEGSDGTPVVGASDRAKVFLSSCIPYLQFDNLLINFKIFGSEFDPDGDIMSVVNFLFDEL